MNNYPRTDVVTLLTPLPVTPQTPAGEVWTATDWTVAP
jgi:hypothetical protein